MSEQRRRFVLLAGVMVVLAMVVAAASTYFMYREAIDHKGMSLQDFLKSQAALMAVVDENNRLANLTAPWSDTRAMSLSQFESAFQDVSFHHPEQELLLAVRDGDDIVFEMVSGRRIRPGDPLARRFGMHDPVAVPMQRALRGENGYMIGTDYRGHEVLAAYQPLAITGGLVGMVCKIDLAAVSAPYIRAGLIIGVVSLGLIGLGLIVFARLSDPVLREIRRSEQRYRQLVESSNTIIMVLNGRGAVTYINQYGLDFFGYDQEELLGRLAWETLEPEDNPGRSLGMLCVDDGVSTLETANVRKDGSAVWIDWSVRMGLDGEDAPREFVCVGHDITRRKRAEIARRDSEERFRGIAQASPVGIIITDLQGNLLYSNERVFEMTGLGAVDLVQYGWLNQINREDRPRVLRAWYGDHEASDKLEFRLERGRGEPLWILGQAVPLRNDKRDVVGFVVTLTDITNLKEAEGQYKRLTTALDQAGEAVIITDSEGLITYVNPAFEAMSGYPAQEAVGKRPSLLEGDQHPPEFYEEMWDTILTGKVWSGRIKNRRKDGSLYDVDATIGPVRDENGQIINYVGVSRDVTGQLLLEAQLRQAQKLESIGQLSAGIAHEINTPIQYVGDNLRYLQESFHSLQTLLDSLLERHEQARKGEVDPGLIRIVDRTSEDMDLEFIKDEIPQAVEQSLEGVERVARIVRSMKEFSHPGEDQKVPADINKGLENTISVSRNEWKYVAEMKEDLAPDLPLIPCLVSELNQVFLNMIVNAAHAIEEKLGEAPGERGTITVKTSVEDRMVVIRISDTGAGIPEKIRDRIFDPFFTTKEVGKGTGQGLAIAHSVVVTKHGGRISFTSEVGKGSTFIIQLPIPDDE